MERGYLKFVSRHARESTILALYIFVSKGQRFERISPKKKKTTKEKTVNEKC